MFNIPQNITLTGTQISNERKRSLIYDGTSQSVSETPLCFHGGSLVQFITSLNRPISQNPQCTCPISHNASFRTEMCTFLFWIVHCGTWNRWIVGFVTICFGEFSGRLVQRHGRWRWRKLRTLSSWMLVNSSANDVLLRRSPSWRKGSKNGDETPTGGGV